MRISFHSPSLSFLSNEPWDCRPKFQYIFAFHAFLSISGPFENFSYFHIFAHNSRTVRQIRLEERPLPSARHSTEMCVSPFLRTIYRSWDICENAYFFRLCVNMSVTTPFSPLQGPFRKIPSSFVTCIELVTCIPNFTFLASVVLALRFCVSSTPTSPPEWEVLFMVTYIVTETLFSIFTFYSFTAVLTMSSICRFNPYFTPCRDVFLEIIP